MGDGDGGCIDGIGCFTKVRRGALGGITYEHVLNGRGRRALRLSHFVCW